MNRRVIGGYWLPLTLGTLALLLLARVFFAERFVFIPEDLDVVLLVALISGAMIAAIHTIVQISINYLRLRSVQQVRQAMLAEHHRFLSRLDHELKNPLTALRAGVQTLELTDLTAPQQQIVATMAIETRRLSRLVSDLRKLAELEAQPLEAQPVDLRAFVQDIMQMEHERFEAGGRTLLSRVEGWQPIWWVDADLLALAVHNLLDNAFKYSQVGDVIHLVVKAESDLTIQVIDNGIGIAPADLPHIWEELYRSQPTAKIGGLGVGLALVKAIVERHEGTVQVKSAVGSGTTITLRLPALLQN